MADNKDVLVVAEHSDGTLDSTAAELMTAARALAAQTGGHLAAALCGKGLASLAQQAVALGADKVYLAEADVLAQPSADAWVAALEAVVRQASPAAVLVARTPLGRDVAPRLAFRLGVGCAQDCMALSLDQASGAVIAERPVYGGASVARVAVRSTPVVATVRPKVFDAAVPDSSRQGQVVSAAVQLGPDVVRARTVRHEKVDTTGIKLEDARVVISGGRGLGGPEPFKKLKELADLLGGAVGGSRPVCDSGWLPYSQQVGLTGKTVTADLYVAIAISGASQHIAGISSVKNIVAINRDGDANIFKEAQYGVVGDWQKVVPAFLEKVRELVRS